VRCEISGGVLFLHSRKSDNRKVRILPRTGSRVVSCLVHPVQTVLEQAWKTFSVIVSSHQCAAFAGDVDVSLITLVDDTGRASKASRLNYISTKDLLPQLPNLISNSLHASRIQRSILSHIPVHVLRRNPLKPLAKHFYAAIVDPAL
jgi:hypothetical protein